MSVHIASPNHVFRDMLETICRDRRFDIGQSVSRPAELDGMAAGDLVLLHGIETPVEAEAAIAEVHAAEPEARVLLLVPDEALARMRAQLGATAHAILPEGDPADALIGAMRVVAAGYRVVDPDEAPAGPNAAPAAAGAAALGRNGSRGPGRAELPHLSGREAAILAKLLEGQSNKDIANALGICEATVKVHLRTCFRKLGVHNRTQAAMWAARHMPSLARP